jgi:hypothetical protein
VVYHDTLESMSAPFRVGVIQEVVEWLEHDIGELIYIYIGAWPRAGSCLEMVISASSVSCGSVGQQVGYDG